MLSNPAGSSLSGSMILAAVQDVSRELDSLRRDSGPELSARLAGAGDELAAILDEMRQQQEEIGGLLAGAEADRAATLRRFLATLPLATVLTTGSGTIVEANTAAHTVLQLPRGTLAGKPLFAFVAQGDRGRLRSALTEAAHGSDLLPAGALLKPRYGAGVPSYFALVREAGPADPADEMPGTAAPEPNPLVRWVILPDYEDGPPSHQQLEALTRLCRLGADDEDLQDTLTQVVRLSLPAVAGADDVSLLVGNPREPSMTIGSSGTAQYLDGLQHTRGRGPSFDAYRTRRPVALEGDAVVEHEGLAGDTRARSIRSLLAVPLVAGGLATGVLTVYSGGGSGVATLAALRQVMPFVEAAQTLIRHTRAREEMRVTQDQLQAALTSRAVIDQAKGMIMISLKCGPDEAFNHLVEMSSRRHEKARDIAQRMVDDVAVRASQPSVDPAG